MEAAEVVVVGGGCVGTSVAFHLAALGCTDVLLLEAGSLGSGSSSRAAGGIRLQHADVLNARIVQRSLAEFVRFDELTGVPIDFKQVGYLFLLDTDEQMAVFRRAVEVLCGTGLPRDGPHRDVRDLGRPREEERPGGLERCPRRPRGRR